MRFTDPLWLALILPIAAALAWSWRRVHGIARPRKAMAFSLRFLMGVALAIALAGPQWFEPHRGTATIFVLDRSDSIDSSDRQRALEFINQAIPEMGPDDLTGVVVAAKEARMEVAVGRPQRIETVQSDVPPGESDLAAAVRLASANFPDGKARRIVVLTDGNETNGDFVGAAQSAAADGIEIDTVTLGSERRQEALIAAVEAPEQARLDQPVSIRAVVESSAEQTVVLDLDRDGRIVQSLETRLRPGRNSVLMQDMPPKTGFQRYRVTMRANQDQDIRNNLGATFVNVRGRPRVLILQDRTEDQVLRNAIAGRGIDVDVAGPGGAPLRAESLQSYDALILNDFNARGMNERQQSLIRSAVRDTGIGFAMIGGESSFLPGGYYGTPIAEILPVDLDVRQRKDFPSTSIAIMVDCSGSMSMEEDGQQKIRLAAQAAEQTIRLMGPRDRVAVAGSSNGIEFLVPFGELGDKQAAIEGARKLAVTGGGIYVRPSIEKAEIELNKEPSKVRHFILLADGNDSTDQEGALETAARMRANKITTTVVAIGDGKDVPFLRRLAVVGGGRFYLATRANQLPAIFTQDASLVSRSAIEEGAFIPKIVGDDEVLNGIDGLPPLLAYCLADSRPLARTILRTQKDDPLLAKWQFGLGTSLAFTSDAQRRWASRWVAWGGFDTFWSQATRAITRRNTDNRYQTSARLEGGKGRLELKAFDRLGNPIAANATVRVTSPSGEQREVAIVAQAPGVYSGEFPASEVGSYVVSVAEPGTGAAKVSTTGLNVAYPPEYRTTKPNLPLLQAVTEAARGKELKSAPEAFRPVANPGASIAEIWWAFVAFALFLLPVDIAIRRIAIPFAEFFASMRARFTRAPAVPEPARLERLQAAKVQAAKVRSAAGTSASKVATNGSEAPPKPDPNGPASSPPTTSPTSGVPSGAKGKPDGTTTAKSLLEAKRKRQG